MRRSSVLLLLACIAGSAAGQGLGVEVVTLDNGMKFLLVPRRTEPHVIAAGWVAKVGSVNERPGITGISHFFEHLMFKGTRTIGTRRPEEEAAASAAEERMRGELRRLVYAGQYERWRRGEIEDPWDAAHDTDEMKRIREELGRLTARQKELIVTSEFDRVYTAMGVSNINAFTSEDMTFYFVDLPANKLELWAWMESDRLTDSVFREFYSERDVVHEERRLRTESTPTGKFREQFDAMFWQSSPYSWPVIGWPSDLESYTRKQAESYFETYYGPGNVVGVLVGDFDAGEAQSLVKRYFGRLKKGPAPPPVVTLEMRQLAEKRMVAEGDFQPQIEVRYHTVPFSHRDEAPLEVLVEILNGRTGRLHLSLVEDLRVAVEPRARHEARRYGGFFSFRAECQGDARPEDVEQAWYGVLDRLQDELVPERELRKVKNRRLAASYRRRRGNYDLMIDLGIHEALGGWQHLEEAPARIDAVSRDDVRRVAKAYFGRAGRAVALYHRAVREEPIPAKVPLDPALRGMAERRLASLQGIEDPGRLRRAIEGLTRQRDAVDPKYHPAFDYVIDRLRKRISKTEGAK